MKFLFSIYRATVSLVLFVLFGIGGLVATPVILILHDVERCTHAVRILWIPIVKLFVWTGLIGIDCTRLAKIRGSVIASTHPSLIDVVIVLALVPKTLFIARHSLKKNLFMSAMIHNASLPDDERLVDAAKIYLARGWNVLIFPEGTRSPASGGLCPLKRGAAQLALRSGVPLVPLAILQSPFRILGKHQYAWQMGHERVVYSLVSRDVIPAVRAENESVHGASRRITGELEIVLKETRL